MASCLNGQFCEATAATWDEYALPRYHPAPNGARRFGGRKRECRPQTALKKRCECCGRVHMGWCDRRRAFAICRVVRAFSGHRDASIVARQLRRETRAAGLTGGNPLYKRFAYYVGWGQSLVTSGLPTTLGGCHRPSNHAEELRLHWETIGDLEKQYMRAQLARVGAPGTKAIGMTRFNSQGPCLPHRGERPNSRVPDLVRREAQRGAHGAVL